MSHDGMAKTRQGVITYWPLADSR